MCLRTRALTSPRMQEGPVGISVAGIFLARGEREVTGLGRSLETFVGFLVVKATVGLLLGDGWGKTQGCSEQRGAGDVGGPGGSGEGWGVRIPEGRDILEQLLWGSRLLFIAHKKKNKVAFGTTHLSRLLRARWGVPSSSAPLPFVHPRLLVFRAGHCSGML